LFNCSEREALNILFYLSLFSLGALDALQPGHAKALVSSALVGTNASLKQVFLLGGIVAVTHALINSVLAFIIIAFAQNFFNDQFIRYVDIAVGSVVIAIALYLIWNRFFQHKSSCCGSDDHHKHNEETTQKLSEMSVWQIILLGLVSGLSPCPVVLTALISAIAVGKGWEAFWGISVFSMGMGAVLIGVGAFTLYGVKKARYSVLSNPVHMRRFSQACAVLVLFVGTFLVGKALFFYQPEQEAPMSLINITHSK
jgi:nickel/cobalt transporter (NicO) family protein